MSGAGAKGIAALVAVLVIFVGGVLVGGSWATGAAGKSQYERDVACLPAQDRAQLDACLMGGPR